jgi:hypothetical protein
VIRNIAIGAAKIIGWAALVVLLLYLSAGFAVVPFVLPSAVNRMGTRMLSHRVSLRKAYFNPITLRVVLRDFSVSDADNTEMLGFNKFWIDVSSLNLLRKRLIIKSAGFDGWRVKAVLLPGNRLNLLSLVPGQTPKPPSAAGTFPWTPVVIREFVLRDGDIAFDDQSIGVGFAMRLKPVEAIVTGLSNRLDSEVEIKFKAIVDGKGPMTIDAMVLPYLSPPHVEAAFTMSDYAVRALTPYVGKYTGRAMKEGGRFDARVSCRLVDNKLNATHQILLQDFDFGGNIESKHALPYPFGLAVALLKDRQGRIDISLPLTGDVADPRFNYFHVLGKSFADYFKNLVDSPFKILAGLIFGGSGSGTEQLEAVFFVPGTSLMSEGEGRKLKALARILHERPRLSFEIHGGFDPVVDGVAMKTGTIRGGLPSGDLKKLAETRGKAVVEALTAAGVDKARVKRGDIHATVASMGKVPTEFSATVYEGK